MSDDGDGRGADDGKKLRFLPDPAPKGKVIRFPDAPTPSPFARPQQVAFKPVRVHIAAPAEPPGDWIIEDIRVGNVSGLPRGRVARALFRVAQIWRRLTRWWPRKPPPRTPIEPG